MAAPDNSSYILINGDPALPNGRQLGSLPGIVIGDTGPGGFALIGPADFLDALQSMSGTGIMVRTGPSGASPRTLTSDASIAITNPDGVSGNPLFSVVANSTSQNVRLSLSSVLQSTTGDLNFIPSGTVGITIVGNNITLSGSGAPSDATYITQTPNSGLSNEQALSVLSTGILKSTTSTGVVSIAVANTDYQVGNANLTAISGLTPTQGSLITGTSGGSLTLRSIGTNNQVPVSNGTDWAWATVPSGGGGAPSDADYWVASANGSLTNAVNLGLLTTGILKISVGGAIATPSISATLTSIDGLTPALGSMLIGASSSTYISRSIGTAGQIPTVNGGGTDWAWATPTTVAPVNAAYLTATANGTLTNEVNLGALATGLLLGTVSTGTSTISAVSSGANYQLLSSGTGTPAYYSFLYDTTGVNNNIFLGTSVGNTTLSGGNNFASGSFAGASLTTGNNNTLQGVSSGNALLGGQFNTANGGNSLLLSTGATNTTAMGYGAASAQLSYIDGTYFGYGADASTNALTKAGAFGYQAVASVSGQIALGGPGQQITIGLNNPTGLNASLLLGSDFSSDNIYPILYFKSTAASPNVSASDGALNVLSGALLFTNNAGGTVPVCMNPMTSVGDSIVGGASGVPTRRAIGTAGQIPTVNGGGTDWAWAPPSSSLSVVQQVFTSTGTYTPTSGMQYCVVEAVGGGGGGGGYSSGVLSGGGGGGGGGGAYIRSVFSAATIGASKAVTIGAAGAAGTPGGNGGNGGNTTLGVLLTANGGSGGSGTTGAGGAGGTASGMSSSVLNITGDVGLFSIYGGLNIYGGYGGRSYFGSATIAPIISLSAAGTAGNNAAANSGSGGSGGVSYDSSTAAGGSGAAGVIIITEYI